MPAGTITQTKTGQEVMDSVRRMTGDYNPRKFAISEIRLREMLIANYVEICHEVGWNPQSTKTGSALVDKQKIAFAAGDFKKPVPGEATLDVLALESVFTNWSQVPLYFVEWPILNNWVENDMRAPGAVQRGIPVWYSVQWDMAGSGADRNHQLWVYPAAHANTDLWFQRTVLQMEPVDPAQTSPLRMMQFSFQMTYALERRMAGECLLGMTPDEAQRIGTDKSMAAYYFQQAGNAVQREREERAMFKLQDQVILPMRW